MSHKMINNNCQVMAKPSSSICNLDCTYCFYLEKEHLYPDKNKNWKMDNETLRLYIKQQIEAQSANEVIFSWQGGEPTLLGIDFYKKAIELVNEFNVENKKVTHTFQTNGILINDEWCHFFKDNNILVGISIDGPEELHDKYRVNRSGKPTHKKVIFALNLLRQHGVEFNTLTVVNDVNVKHPEKIYRYLKSIGSNNIQFIPLLEQEAKIADKNGLLLIYPEQNIDSEITEWSVNAKEYGEFLKRVYSIWVHYDIGDIYIQMFEHTYSAWLSGQSQMCHFSETCGSLFALESNGDVYNCDHYVYPEHKLGNIHEIKIKEMNSSDQNIEFGLNKKKTSKDCETCKYDFLCYGGCPKHRIIFSSNGIKNHNYFCESYYAFFSYSEPFMVAMKELVNRGYPAKKLKELL